MIISRTPFRISLCGGGSDLPSFYRKHGGCVLSTSINKYMYISVHPSFQNEQTILKYSKTEIVDSLDAIEHEYFNVILKQVAVSGVEITSTADIPSGTGLGSSSSFTVGLLHSLYAYKNRMVSKEYLANEACKIEIDALGNCIGKQDQYAASYGGLKFYTFNKDDSVFVEPIILSVDSIKKLNRNLMLFFVNGEHDAASILEKQTKNISIGDGETGQRKICALTYELRDRLIRNNIDAVGSILNENWIIKRSLAAGISNNYIDRLYQTALDNGALGGKLLGAGGAGFLLLYVPEAKQEQVRAAMPVKQLDFSFDKQGSSIIFVGD
ncbi:MAG: GHMP kinase [Termitinemataceae bacterium]|nr:MAG: GHMP kinase [Termitinemataceae bacterium]